MQFTEQQLRHALRLKRLGLPWEPMAGHYAHDFEGKIKPGSPFQPGVYFFLDLPCFVDYFGGTNELRDSMVWLPTWEQAVGLILGLNGQLDELAVGAAEGLGENMELDFAYSMIERLITRQLSNADDSTQTRDI